MLDARGGVKDAGIAVRHSAIKTSSSIVRFTLLSHAALVSESATFGIVLRFRLRVNTAQAAC